MLQRDNEGFYFDKVRMNFLQDVGTLWKRLPIDELKEESKIFAIKRAHRSLKYYLSRIEVVAPTRRFFEILLAHQSVLLHRYIFTYIEVANDEYKKRESDAEKDADMLCKTLRKKSSFGYICTKGEDEYGNKIVKAREEREKDATLGLFAGRTFYSVFEHKETKQSRLKYVVYARYSKINGRPCVHKEWRIVGSANIKRRTGIATIRDLINFDFETFFSGMSDKYIIHEELDNDAIGRWLMNFDGRKSLTEEQKTHVKIQARMFRKHYDIESYSGLVQRLKEEQEKIKVQRGARSEEDKRILSLKSFGRFKKDIS